MDDIPSGVPASPDPSREDLAAFMDGLVGVENGRYTRNEAVSEAGVSLEDGRRFWRAMGFPEVPDDERVFTDQDVEMLRGVHDLIRRDTAGAVGFADLAAFSRLTEELDEFELAEMVTAFETLSFDTVSKFGGRVVKLIGDEVMFVAPGAGSAASIGVNLVDRCESDERCADLCGSRVWGKKDSMQ